MNASQPPQDSEPAGAVRQYLSPAQVAERLGMKLEMFRTRIRRGHYAQVLSEAQPGDIIRAGRGRAFSPQLVDRMAAWDASPDDPARLGSDPASLPGDTLIGPAMWAALQGVGQGRVYQQLREARIRRVQGTAEPRDMPEPEPGHGRRLRWRLDAYKAWAQAVSARESNRGGRRHSTGQRRL